MEDRATETLQPVHPAHECSILPAAIPKQTDAPVPTVTAGCEIPSKRSRSDERRINPKQTKLSKPDSFGVFHWKESILYDPKRNDGDQPLTLKHLEEPVEFETIDPFDRLANEEFNIFATKHNIDLKNIDLDALADELCKRQAFLRGQEFNNMVWKPLLEPCNCVDQKKILAFMALTVFCCSRDEQVDLNLAVALIFCISRVSSENIRSKLKKLIKN